MEPTDPRFGEFLRIPVVRLDTDGRVRVRRSVLQDTEPTVGHVALAEERQLPGCVQWELNERMSVKKSGRLGVRKIDRGPVDVVKAVLRTVRRYISGHAADEAL